MTNTNRAAETNGLLRIILSENPDYRRQTMFERGSWTSTDEDRDETRRRTEADARIRAAAQKHAEDCHIHCTYAACQPPVCTCNART